MQSSTPRQARRFAVACLALSMAIPAAASADRVAPGLQASLERFRSGPGVAALDDVITARDGSVVRAMRGALTAPSTDQPERVARRLVLEARALFGVEEVGDLETLAVVGRPGGARVVRLRQRLDGAPVLGAQATALLDGDGRVRAVSQSLVDLGRPVEEPTLAPEEAAALVAAGELVSRPGVEPSSRQARLVWLRSAEGESPVVPAYDVSFGPVISLLANWHVFVDARSGEVLGRVNRISRDRSAQAWAENPLRSELLPVTLDGLDLDAQACLDEAFLPETLYDGSPAPDASTPRLCTPRVAARSCVDFGDVVSLALDGYGERELHVCTEVHMAVPNDAPPEGEDPDDDLSNDFWYDDARALGYLYDTDPAGGEDLFAEAHALYHVDATLRYFAALDPTLSVEGEPIVAGVNWRVPIDVNALLELPSQVSRSQAIEEALSEASTPVSPLYPFEGAFYIPLGGEAPELGQRATHGVVFFQGRRTDPAYDADVITHETTHAMITSILGEEGLASPGRDELGVHEMARAMSEAYADFFAAARSGDPVIGDYAVSAIGPGGARDLSARPRATCPSHLIGEEHHDSAPFAQALWELRESLGEASEIERAVAIGMAGLLPDARFREGALVTVAAVGAELGEDAAAQARELFGQYGFDDEHPCERIVTLGGGEAIEQLVVPGTEQVGPVTASPFAPAVVQLRVEIGSGYEAIAVRYELDDAPLLPEDLLLPPAAPARIGLLVRQGDEPVRFATEGPFAAEADELDPSDEVINSSNPARRQLLFREREGGLLPPGVYHLALVNMGPSDGLLRQLVVTPVSEVFDDPDDPPELEPWDFPASSCGCAVPGRARSRAPLLSRLLSLR